MSTDNPVSHAPHSTQVQTTESSHSPAFSSSYLRTCLQILVTYPAVPTTLQSLATTSSVSHCLTQLLPQRSPTFTTWLANPPKSLTTDEAPIHMFRRSTALADKWLETCKTSNKEDRPSSTPWRPSRQPRKLSILRLVYDTSQGFDHSMLLRSGNLTSSQRASVPRHPISFCLICLTLSRTLARSIRWQHQTRTTLSTP
ncbi:hypothetical protein K503DRAFT_72491 [Rhizopogon vinicolor AM-OR11-026]|uniref:Uncharacterized protein n=1 Tax=Rhizopogon vinicolor AM-OR11-026 TaxID=1314800 RepID=A0A1B7N412_9AGAM|nr:hypothetical protein K503DRAFT_72491 [Rhizopogon vinicolor AM-OR11-026]